MSPALDVKPLYTVPELAHAIGIGERRLRRWLKRRDVALIRAGRAVAVPLVSFREAFPEVWASMQVVSGMGGRGTCPVCRATG